MHCEQSQRLEDLPSRECPFGQSEQINKDVSILKDMGLGMLLSVSGLLVGELNAEWLPIGETPR